MKKTILTLLAILVIGFSYGQTKGKTDTIKTILFYQHPVSDEPTLDIGFRIIKDTLKFVRVDSVTFKRKGVIDTAYFVPVLYTQLDDAKKPKLDSLGNPVTNIQYSYIPPTSVFIDGGKNVDDILKKYYASRSKDLDKKKN